MDEVSPYILTHTPSSFQRMIETNYSYGFETNEDVLKANDRDHKKVNMANNHGEVCVLISVDKPA